jgi:phosphotriesterase-related protein
MRVGSHQVDGGAPLTPPGVIRTATGDISPDSLGTTSMHEHVRVSFGPAWYSLRSPQHARFRDITVGLETLADVRWNAFTVLDNMTLEGDEVMTRELSRWRAAGGDAIVDLTSAGLGGDPEAATRIAEAAGVRIVLGFGHYTHRAHTPWDCAASIDELADALDREARFGVGGSNRLPGTLGEIGMSGPPLACERRALRAAARVAARYGMSLSIHVDNTGDYATEHVAECAEEGLPPERVICGHMDERLGVDYHRRVLATGANLGFDTFGSELYFSGAFHHPSDDHRMTQLAQLVEGGFADRIVLAHDVAVKAHLRSFGGNGYDHLLERIVPELQRRWGMGQEVLDLMLVGNPRRLLTCNPPAPQGRAEVPGST